MVVKVQTNGTKSCEDAMMHALEDLANEYHIMLEEFDQAVSAASMH